MGRARELGELAAVYDTGSFGFRNRIINGDMRIDQRNNGASVAAVNSAYFIDRWRAELLGGGAYTVQRSTVAPTGFTNSALITVTTADTSIAGTDYYDINQMVEGFNVADLGWGTANAQTITLSFWVRSSLTGTFSGSVCNGSGNRSYVFSYTISAANTWEQKTVTIPGDTSGTWLTDNGRGLILNFDLGNGSTYTQSSAGSWVATYAAGLTSAVKLIATNGATFYITGVQLEAGSVATPFERRDYGRELQMCQRYCYVLQGVGAFSMLAPLYMPTSTTARVTISLPVTMRSVPTSTFSAANTFLVQQGGAVNLTPSSISATSQAGNVNTFGVDASVSGGSAGTGGALFDNNSSAAKITLSSEL